MFRWRKILSNICTREILFFNYYRTVLLFLLLLIWWKCRFICVRVLKVKVILLIQLWIEERFLILNFFECLWIEKFENNSLFADEFIFKSSCFGISLLIYFSCCTYMKHNIAWLNKMNRVPELSMLGPLLKFQLRLWDFLIP